MNTIEKTNSDTNIAEDKDKTIEALRKELTNYQLKMDKALELSRAFSSLSLGGEEIKASHRIKELEVDLEKYKLEAEKAQEMTKSVAMANANAAEMYVELEEKSDKIKELKEQMEWEQMTARKVQVAIMCPPLKTFPGIDISVRTQSALLLNGDFYIVEPLDRFNTALFLADGEGHGVPAALMAMMAKSFFMTIAKNNFSAEGILTKLNSSLNEYLYDGAYITAFLLIYNSKTGKVRYSGAGHPEVLHWKANSNEIDYLESDNPVLGVIPDLPFSEKEIEVEVGDRFFMYTDGIPELRGKDATFFGMDKMLQIIKDGCPSKRVLEIEDKLYSELTKFVIGGEQADDMSFLGFEILKSKRRDKVSDLIDDFNEKSSEDDYQELFEKGVQSLKVKKYNIAAMVFSRILEFQPDNFKASFNLGIANAKVGDIYDAVKRWEKTLAIIKEKDKPSERKVIETMSRRYIQKVENLKVYSKVKASLIEIGIELTKDKLLEFCKKAVALPTFNGLQFEKKADSLKLYVKGSEEELRFSLIEDSIIIGEESFRSHFPKQLYLFLEGLALRFSGTFVVSYYEKKTGKCNITIVDGIYTSCGDRCLKRDVEFPIV